jgi:hypothetical protein
LARRFLAIVLIGFTVGSVVNVGMEARYEPGVRALLVHTDGQLSTITGTEFSPLRGRYWVASAVHDVAWSGVVVVPDPGLISSSRFHNLANVDVRTEDYNPILSQEQVQSLDGLPSIRGVGNLTGNDGFAPFAVVWSVGGKPVPILRLWFHGDSMFLIDDRVTVTDADR